MKLHVLEAITMKTLKLKNSMPLVSLISYFGILMALFIFSGNLFATDQSLGNVAQSIRTSMGDVASLITAASYVAGIGFAMMGMLKLKAHKDNPTQVPLSQPLVLLIIAAGLVFLPSIISTAGQTIWGGDQTSTGTLGGGSADGGGENNQFATP
jgi:intracellular multiplication protein IcmD